MLILVIQRYEINVQTLATLVYFISYKGITSHKYMLENQEIKKSVFISYMSFVHSVFSTSTINILDFYGLITKKRCGNPSRRREMSIKSTCPEYGNKEEQPRLQTTLTHTKGSVSNYSLDRELCVKKYIGV